VPLTFAQLKTVVRARVFPAGEARNLRAAHDKSIVDCLVDMQRWVDCLQSNNTHLVPHCATFYNCGLTSFDFFRSQITRLSVIDKINPDTHLEDADAADDYCTEIEYRQVGAANVRQYLGKSITAGCCLSGGLFFAIPDALCGYKYRVPVPTDEGLTPGLSPLPLGFHYPQESTNSSCGRARAGVWALDGGRVYVAPWIQSTETVVVRWRGIKRDWVDADLVDDDPSLIRAVELYLRWEHARDWDRDANAAAGYELECRKSLGDLMYDCAQETQVRSAFAERDGVIGGGGSSAARGIAPVTKLYYNTRQQATEHCPGDPSGPKATAIVPADTVASADSVADANARALEQAHELARAQACEKSGSGDSPETVYFTRAVDGIVPCPYNQPPNPDAEGGGVPYHVDDSDPRFFSTISRDDATRIATDYAVAQAAKQLHCTYYNAAKTKTAACPSPSVQTASHTVEASDPECTSTISQTEANNCAERKAYRLAVEALACDGYDSDPVSEEYTRTYKLYGPEVCRQELRCVPD
jgi:hypothetical protein